MNTVQSKPEKTALRRDRSARPAAQLALCLLLACLGAGCSALRPLHGVPVNYYPRELNGQPRSGKKTIDLSLLRQTPPEQHLIDAGDVLGIYVEGVLGRREEIPPVHFSVNDSTPPSLGFPIPVREDGTISLPLAKPMMVRGLTVRAAEDLIRKAYTEDQQILQGGRDRILVSLQRPRTYNVLVIRQEAATATMQQSGGMGGTLTMGEVKRGTGKLVALPAYKNDVLHALAETGGLPGLDAENAIYVLRRKGPRTRDEHARVRAPDARAGVMSTSATRPAKSASKTTSSELLLASAEVSAEAPWGHTTAVANYPAAAQPILPPPQQPLPQQGLPQGAPADPTQIPTSPDRMNPEPMPGASPAGPGHTLPNSGGGPVAPPGQPFYHGDTFNPLLPPAAPELAGPMESLGMDGRNTQVIKIPVRLQPGETPRISEGDVILHDGDIVFIESRESEIFYTGGLLGGGQYVLPRDYDLDVLGAIAVASGRMQGGGGGGGIGNRIGGISAMNMDISFSASDVVVLRQFPDGNQVPIKIDLNKALRDPKYRIRIQPGDYIVLQYKPLEAVGAFFERNLLSGGLLALAFSTFNNGGTGR